MPKLSILGTTPKPKNEELAEKPTEEQTKETEPVKEKGIFESSEYVKRAKGKKFRENLIEQHMSAHKKSEAERLSASGSFERQKEIVAGYSGESGIYSKDWISRRKTKSDIREREKNLKNLSGTARRDEERNIEALKKVSGF